LGTYNGHEGAVWDAAVNFSSTRLLTASADRTAKLWDVESGMLSVFVAYVCCSFSCLFVPIAVFCTHTCFLTDTHTHAHTFKNHTQNNNIGNELFSFDHKASVRTVGFAASDHVFLTLTCINSHTHTPRTNQHTSGKELFSFDHKASVRTVGFAAGDRMFLTAQENNFNQRGCIYIFNAADDPAEQT
jgi:WD40 repeat protein